MVGENSRAWASAWGPAAVVGLLAGKVSLPLKTVPMIQLVGVILSDLSIPIQKFTSV